MRNKRRNNMREKYGNLLKKEIKEKVNFDDEKYSKIGFKINKKNLNTNDELIEETLENIKKEKEFFQVPVEENIFLYDPKYADCSIEDLFSDSDTEIPVEEEIIEYKYEKLEDIENKYKKRYNYEYYDEFNYKFKFIDYLITKYENEEVDNYLNSYSLTGRMFERIEGNLKKKDKTKTSKESKSKIEVKNSCECKLAGSVCCNNCNNNNSYKDSEFEIKLKDSTGEYATKNIFIRRCSNTSFVIIGCENIPHLYKIQNNSNEEFDIYQKKISLLKLFTQRKN